MFAQVLWYKTFIPDEQWNPNTSVTNKDTLFAIVSLLCVDYEMVLKLNYYELDEYKGEQMLAI